jgi:hypothetical protein
MKNNIFLILLLVLLNSCKDCVNTTEPTLNVHFDDNQTYDKVYGLGGRDTLSMTYSLPVSLTSDTSIYIFFSSSKVDTFGMSYKRIISYNSTDCGFSIRLESFKLLDISTFSNGQFSIHQTNYSSEEPNKYYYEVTLYR